MKTSLFSVSYAGLWGQTCLELPAFIERAKSLGYDGVMLMGKQPHLPVLGLDDKARRAELREQLHRARLDVACLAGYTSFTAGLECPEVPLIEMQVKYVHDLARLSSELDCKLVRVFTGYEKSGQSPFRRPFGAPLPSGACSIPSISAPSVCADASHRPIR